MGGEPERFIATAANERQPSFSPNGRHLDWTEELKRLVPTDR